ncbi:hypothetical protein Tco_1425566, partial [Tanacetum coccineum]
SLLRKSCNLILLKYYFVNLGYREMSTKKIIAICQSSGEFLLEIKGSMLYRGGEAYAVDLDTDSSVTDFKQDLADTFGYSVDNMLIKYFIPGNEKILL